VIRWGGKGLFLACAAYPKCRNSYDFERNERGEVVVRQAEEGSHGTCPTCGSPMLLKRGPFGEFYACSRYPQCKTTRPKHLDIPCPREGCDGFIIERRSRKGKRFYGCTRWPQCDFVIWDPPVGRPCPQCGAPFMTEKRTRKGNVILCKKCGYKAEGDS